MGSFFPICWTSLGRTVLLALLVLLPLIFATDTLEAFETPKTALLQLGALVLTAALLSAAVAGRRGDPAALRLRWREPLNVGLLLFGLSAVLSTVLSLSPSLSLRGGPESCAGLNTVAAYLAIFVGARLLLGQPRLIRAALAAVVVAGAGAAVYALFQVVHLDPVPWAGSSTLGSYSRPAGPLGHANHLAEYLALATPPTLYFAARAWRQRAWPALAVLALTLAGCWLALLATLSRAGWLGLTCALLVLFAGGCCLAQRRGRFLAGALAVPAVLAGLVLAVAAVCPEALRQRLDGLTVLDGRALLWHAALDIFGRHPLHGAGLETFQIAFCEVRTPAYWNVEWAVLPNHAHNQFLHILATQGVLGGLAILALLAGLLVAAVRAWRQTPVAERGLVLVLLALIAAFLATALFSFTVAAVGATIAAAAGMLAGLGGPAAPAPPAMPWRGPSRILAGAGLLAVAALAWNIQHVGMGQGAAVVLGVSAALGAATWACCRCLDPEAPASSRRAPTTASPFARAAQGVTWAVAAVLAVVAVALPYRAGVMCRSGEDQFTTDPDLAISTLRRAVALDSGRDDYWTRLGGALHAQALRLAEGAERRRHLDEARRALEQARQLQPLSGYHHENLARLLGTLAAEGLTDPNEVFAAFDAALERDPCNVLFCLDAAQAALALRDTARCRRYAERARTLDMYFAPPLAQLGYAALMERQPQEGCVALEAACGLNWCGLHAEEMTARANLVMAEFHRGGYGQVRRWAPPLLAKAPHLVEVRRALEESQRRGP
jgi:O-antigen ligase